MSTLPVVRLGTLGIAEDGEEGKQSQQCREYDTLERRGNAANFLSATSSIADEKSSPRTWICMPSGQGYVRSFAVLRPVPQPRSRMTRGWVGGLAAVGELKDVSALSMKSGKRVSSMWSSMACRMLPSVS